MVSLRLDSMITDFNIRFLVLHCNQRDLLRSWNFGIKWHLTGIVQSVQEPILSAEN